MSKSFFIADTHFGSETIIRYEKRPFGSVQEMEEALIAKWNQVVEKDDTHYDYASMSVYELRKLLNTKFNSYRNSREARRELERRGVVLTRKYNRSTDRKKIMEDE